MAKPPPVVVFKAEPGWHVVVLEHRGEEPDEEGRDMYRLSVIPIQRWGFGCPGNLRRSVSEELSPISVLMGALSANPLLGQHLPFEPLDPRAETPSFFQETEHNVMFGVFAPGEGTADEIAAKVRDAVGNYKAGEGSVGK